MSKVIWTRTRKQLVLDTLLGVWSFVVAVVAAWNHWTLLMVVAVTFFGVALLRWPQRVK